MPLLAFGAAVLTGTVAAVHYARLGLTLSHWDARAHLVVARRILDSLFPGWQQVGAVWLPLPHLLNMIPVQVDAWYRNGASAVTISILSMGVAAWAVSSLILRTTGSTVAAIAAPVLVLSNPDVLYLQSTPMTEPLLFGTTLLAVELTARWTVANSAASNHETAGSAAVTYPAHAGEDLAAVDYADTGCSASTVVPGIAIAAACMTRYEAWPITVALILLTGAVLLRRGVPFGHAVNACARLAAYPAVAIALFLVNSRWTVGAWFISSGFFLPENTVALGHPVEAWRQVREGVYHLSGTALVWSAYASAFLTIAAFVRSRTKSALVLLLALPAAGALPFYAYYQGHPFIARYGIAMVVGYAATAGAAVGLVWRPLQPVMAVAVVTLALVQAPPLDRAAPMIVEAQRDAANMEGRKAVTAYLVQHYDGRVILLSMGSLAHYVQDLSREGFRVRDFLHEGNDGLWTYAILQPKAFVGWILIEERAEGGDSLFRAAKENKHFLDGFTRVAEGGGAALFRATPHE